MKNQYRHLLVISLIISLIILIPLRAQEDQKIQKLIQEFESLIDPTISTWKVSTSDSPEAASPSFDDSHWSSRRRTFTLRESKVIWLRHQVIIPPYFAAIPTTGQEISLQMTFRGLGIFAGKIFLNGQLIQNFTLDFGNSSRTITKSFPIIAQAKPQSSCLIALRLENKGRLPLIPRKKAEPGTYLQLQQARLVYPQAIQAEQKLNKCLLDLKLGWQLLELSPRPPQPPHRLRPLSPIYRKRINSKENKRVLEAFFKAARQINLEAIKEGNYSKVENSLKKFYFELQPVIKYAKSFTIYVGGNSHIDLAWLWRWLETIEVGRATFETILQNMDEYPEIIYIQSQAQLYQWIEEKYPELFEKIRQKVREGRWEIVGGMWVEPDCNLIDGESFVRQILYGKRYFQEKFGVEVTIGWNPDSFGYNWNMPQFLVKSGFKAFVTQKIFWNDTTSFPYFLFWWEAPDGSRILTYFPPTGYVGTLRAERMIEGLKNFERNTGLQKTYILYGLGDHGGGPNREMLDRARAHQKQALFPHLIHKPFHEFIQKIKKKAAETIPLWKDELYLEYHRGTYTTQARIKKWNRQSEARLTEAEKIASLCFLWGERYPQKPLTRAWKNVLLNQFHDILPGSSIHPVYRDAEEFYRRAAAITRRVTNHGLLSLAKKIKTAPPVNHLPLLVFNSLSWNRDGLVKVILPARLAARENLVVENHRGEIVPSQIITTRSGKLLCFLAKDVPAVGYKLYQVRQAPSLSYKTTLQVEKFTLENKFFKLVLHPETGNIISIFDKQAKREVVSQHQQANQLQLFEDIPSNWDAWNIGYTGRQWTLDKYDRIEIGQQGPVFASIKIHKSFLGLAKARREPTTDFPSSFFTQEIILYNDLPRIDIKMTADWWEEHTLLKVAFPVEVESKQATYEIPYAFIQRPTTRNTPWEKARFEVSAIRWADLSDDDYGVSLLNNCKYGHDIKNNVIRLTLLRSPVWPDPLADRGKHEFSYALYPHQGDWRQADTVLRAYEFNVPLKAILLEKKPSAENSPSLLPPELSFFKVSPSNIILAAIKKAEDRDTLIFRFYEAEGLSTEATVEFYKKPHVIYETDLMENRQKKLSYQGQRLVLSFRKNEIKTIEIGF
jgi:alpha-mannosidase